MATSSWSPSRRKLVPVTRCVQLRGFTPFRKLVLMTTLRGAGWEVRDEEVFPPASASKRLDVILLDADGARDDVAAVVPDLRRRFPEALLLLFSSQPESFRRGLERTLGVRCMAQEAGVRNLLRVLRDDQNRSSGLPSTRPVRRPLTPA